MVQPKPAKTPGAQRLPWAAVPTLAAPLAPLAGQVLLEASAGALVAADAGALASPRHHAPLP